MNLNNIFKKKNIVDIDTFFEYCKNNFEYGWIDKKGMKHFERNNSPEYFLQTPIELLENKISICWDRIELYRAFFNEMKIKFETYFLYYYINDNCCPSHSILVYYYDGKVYWFEPMFNSPEYNHCGIHEYNTIEQLLSDFKKHFTLNGIAHEFLPKDTLEENYFCYKYTKPRYHIQDNEFYEHCRNGKEIDIWLKNINIIVTI